MTVGGRVERWCWVNFPARGRPTNSDYIVGQGPTALTVGTGGDCLDIFSLVYHFFFLSPSLKYCLKGPLISNQSINQPLRDVKVCLKGETKLALLSLVKQLD